MATAGAWGGWTLNDQLRDPAPILVKRSITVVSDAPPRDGTTPSVVGLGVDSARQALADAGIPAGGIDVVSRPNFETVGTVLEQRPPAAAKLADRGRLVVASPAATPVLTGKGQQAARDALDALGASARIVPRFEAGAHSGSVLKTKPAAGRALTSTVTLVVAAPESAVKLAQVEPDESGCSVDSPTVAGTERNEVLVCPAGEDPTTLTFALPDGVTRLTGRLGFVDDAEPDARAQVRVRSGRRVVASLTVSAGGLMALNVATQRGPLVIEVEAIGDTSGSLALVDATLSGSRVGVDALTGQGSP